MSDSEPGRRAHGPARAKRGTLLFSGGLAGLLAGAAGVALSEAVARLFVGVTSPLLAVGNRAVDTTPQPLKDWAIETFGSNDKAVLVGGVVGTVAVLAVIAGMVGVRRPGVAQGAFVVLSLIAGAAAVTDRAASAAPVLLLVPVVVLLVVALGSLALLLRAARGRSLATGAPAVTAGGPTDPTPEDSPARAPTADARPEPDEPRETLEGDKARMHLPSHRGTGASDGVPDRVPGDDLPAAFDRRAFLASAAAVAAVAAAGGIVGQALGGPRAAAARADLSIPAPADAAPPVPQGASLPVKGISPYLSSNRNFYRVDTALAVPDLPVDGYTLRVHGMVDKELNLSFRDLLSRRLVERRITLTCVSNPVGGPYVDNATWIGVRVKDLLEEAGVSPDADAMKSTSTDNMTIGTPLEALTDDRDALIAVAMNGEPLPLEHGFPVRMVVPGLYGYVSATKWLVDLEVTRFDRFKAYWTTRGYDARAPIKTSSRIDVPGSFAKLQPGRTPVAGVAWSQNRGVAKVEVRVDKGEWHEAELAAEDNINTWRQWVWQWDAPAGNHTLEVRATDKTGHTQTSQRAPVAPDGATGWHSVAVMVQG